LASAPPERSGGASGIVATARLIGQATGAALVALSFGIAGRHGPTLALGAGCVFSGLASVASGLRLFAPSHRAGHAVTSTAGARAAASDLAGDGKDAAGSA
jgi:MFS transporter, DHA2 family, multidrug resistance protein